MKPIKTILLIEDDSDDQELFQNALEEVSPEAELITAKHGVEAIDKLNEKMPDIIFLDLNLPMMGGLEFLTKLKKTVDYNEIPVIIFTTSASESDIIDTAVLDADEFIVKPNTYGGIVNEVKRVLATNWEKDHH